MTIASKNIKNETVKMSVFVTIVTAGLTAALLFVSTIGNDEVRKADELSNIELLVLRLESKINSAILSYQILAAGNTVEAMQTLDNLKILDADIAKTIEAMQLAPIESGELKQLVEKTIPIVQKKYEDLKTNGQKMVIFFIDDKNDEGKAAAKEEDKIAKELFSSIEAIGTDVPKIATANFSAAAGYLS